MHGGFAVAAEGILLRTWQLIRGEVLVFTLLIAAGAVACFTLWLLLKRGKLCHIQATSISGAVSHNIGQVIAAMFVVRTPMLLGTYLPVLIGVGMLVGSLTGIVTDRVLRSMHLTAE